MLTLRSLPARIPAILRRLWDVHPPLLISGVVAASLGVFFLAGVFLDPRYVTGAPVWLKPLKFSVSITVYTLTILWMLGFVEGKKKLVSALAWLILGSFAVEMLVIGGQAARGVTSHFNVSSPLNGALWISMGAAILVLWLANLAVAALLLRQRIGNPVLAWGVRLGLLIAVLGLAEGFLMTSPTAQQLAGARAGLGMTTLGAHSVGVPDGGPGLPLVGWSTAGGDLRIGHFVGMHALQVLPLLAWLIERRRDLATRQKTRLVFVGAGVYLGLTALVTWQALRAQPLTAPDGLTLGVLAALLTFAALGARLVLGRRIQPASSPGL